jgi:hypothetical protein
VLRGNPCSAHAAGAAADDEQIDVVIGHPRGRARVFSSRRES